jgi:hypothetical protein
MLCSVSSTSPNVTSPSEMGHVMRDVPAALAVGEAGRTLCSRGQGCCLQRRSSADLRRACRVVGINNSATSMGAESKKIIGDRRALMVSGARVSDSVAYDAPVEVPTGMPKHGQHDREAK